MSTQTNIQNLGEQIKGQMSGLFGLFGQAIGLVNAEGDTARAQQMLQSMGQLLEFQNSLFGSTAPATAGAGRKGGAVATAPMATSLMTGATAPKRRGRPAGSKNANSGDVESRGDQLAIQAGGTTGEAAPKRRGRPKGSTNKAKGAPAAAGENGEAPKRRGRPKGSGKKATEVQAETSAAEESHTATE